MIVTKDKETRFSGTSVLPGSEVLHLCDVCFFEETPQKLSTSRRNYIPVFGF